MQPNKVAGTDSLPAMQELPAWESPHRQILCFLENLQTKFCTFLAEIGDLKREWRLEAKNEKVAVVWKKEVDRTEASQQLIQDQQMAKKAALEREYEKTLAELQVLLAF